MKSRTPKGIAFGFIAVWLMFIVAASVPALWASSAQNANSSAAARPYDEKADAAKDLSVALKSARLNHKRVLVDFGANWCPDCIVLSKIFEEDSVKPFLESNFVVVKVDVGRFNKNLDIVKKYGNPIGKGIPAVVVLDPGEKVMASTSGGELSNP